MKKLVFVLIVSLFSLSSFTQERGNKGFNANSEKYYAQKVAYLTTELELTPDESAAFWPVYNECENKKQELLDQMRSLRREIFKRDEEISEEESQKTLDSIHVIVLDMAQLEVDYDNKYCSIITARKALMLKKSEKDFRRKLLRELGHKRRQGEGREGKRNGEGRSW